MGDKGTVIGRGATNFQKSWLFYGAVAGAGLSALVPGPAWAVDVFSMKFWSQAGGIATVSLWSLVAVAVLSMLCVVLMALLSREKRLRRWTQSRSDDERQALEAVPCGVALFDKDGKQVLRNRQFSLLGPDAETDLKILDGQSTPDMPCSMIQRRVKTGNGESYDINFRNIPGSGSFVIASPVSDQVLREEENAGLQAELAHQKAWLRMALDGSARGIGLFDENLNLIAANDRFFELYDLPEDFGTPGTPLADIYNASVTRGTVLSDTAGSFRERRLTMVRSLREEVAQDFLTDGRVIALRHRPLPGGGSFLSIEDATGGYASQRQLNDARQEAARAHQAKADFYANVSHELRTPLNAIIGFSEIIKDELFGEVGNGRYRQYADDIYESGTHLLGLVNDILDLSQIESGSFVLREETIAAPVLVDSVLRSVQERAQANRIRLRLDIAPHLPNLRADAGSLRQILVNLLLNAIKFSATGSEVVVLLRPSKSKGLEFVVHAGKGAIPQEDLVRVMEPFGNSDAKMTRRFDETGLGLPLTRHLVDLHGGDMLLESEVGQGTTVTVTFPPDRVSPAIALSAEGEGSRPAP
ncbi:MAG: PAS-domain containing protein [Pseudomonadota bacterium]